MKTNEKAVSAEIKNSLAKKKTNKGIIIGIIVAAIIAFMIGIIIYNGSDNDVSEQLDLGQKYLEDQDYEQAIVAFNKAIEIDDKCSEAYVGLVETYIRMGEYDKALETAQKGYERTGDESLAEYMEMLKCGNISRSDGKIMKTTTYDGNGAVLYYHEFSYDKQGRQASVTHYNSEHVFVSTIDFLYDENGNQLVSYHYDSLKGNLVKREAAYENGLLISVKWGGEFPGCYIWEYDEKGRVIKLITEYETVGNGIDSYELYQYDENDNLIRVESYEKDNDKLYSLAIWEYQNGKIYTKSYYDGSGNLTCVQVYENDGRKEYDGNGKLIRFVKNN